MPLHTPFVSCIMPTRNRMQFAGQAIWYFLRQDYANKELVIVDDGEESVEALVPKDERIRYARLPHRVTLGAKRNLACELSRGELIAHWDDDDWMSPQRLSVQVAHLTESSADVCGARDLLHYRPAAGEAWLYHAPEGTYPWLAGCTLLYRRATWAAHRFPEISVGEDGAFVSQIPPEHVRAVPDSSFYIALIHPGNTGAKNLSDSCWQRRPLDEVSRLLEFDRDFYVALRGGVAAEASGAGPDTATLTVAAQIDVASGYGSMSEYLIRGLAREGARVNVVPLNLDPDGLSEEFREILHRSQPDSGAPVLYFSWVRSDLERFRAAKDLFINTMWESERLPAGWAEPLNRARAVIVPTRFCARVLRESGVRVPIHVIPEGIDPDVYHLEDRPDHAGMTTLTVGPLSDRKNVQEGIAAWKQAFAGDPDARLVVKTQYNYQNYNPDDPRISYIDAVEHTRGIAHWYRQADVLLALGNEGFGLPLIEGMATGLPVVALNSEGQADVCAEARDLLLPVEPVTWQVYNPADFGPCGLRGLPGVADVAARLRWVAAHRDEARAMGRAASAWVIQNRNIWAKAPAVLGVLEEHVQPPRPLHRSRTIWTPSWRTACGVAEYTAYLQAQLPGVRVSAQRPDLRSVRLLHVEYADGLFSEMELARCVQQARAARVPVVVNEHSVGSRAQAWERDADVLTAMTERGVSTLRQRWPTRKVEYMPHGCPTWFPPRKSARGRTIAAFGFLEKYKGWTHLLDVLRAVPNAELLMYSHAKSAEAESEWNRAIAGLPARRVRDFLPVEEIARRLAAEADILVFWYDEVGFAAASGAVRVALATGVPVLTSPTGWFEELRDVTFQPSNLVQGIEQLLDDTALRARLTSAARAYCEANSWSRVAERHQALWQSLESN